MGQYSRACVDKMAEKTHQSRPLLLLQLLQLCLVALQQLHFLVVHVALRRHLCEVFPHGHCFGLVAGRELDT